MPTFLTYLRSRSNLWMNNLLVIYAFFIPITASVSSRIAFMILILYFIRGNIIYYLKESWKNPVFRGFVYLLMVYLFWMIGSDDLKNGWKTFKHLDGFLFLGIFLTVIDGRYIGRILAAFLFGMMLSELLSYGMHFGILPWEFRLFDEAIYKSYAIGDPSPFLHHIHYGVLLAFTVVFLAQRVMYWKDDRKLKILMSLFVLTASANIFITGGRTGYMAFFPLLIFFVLYYHKKWILPATIGAIVFAFGMYQASPILQKKVDQTKVEVSKLFQDDTDFRSSLGQRVGFWVYSAKVIEDNFWFGVGTGDAMAEVRSMIPQKDEVVKLIKHEHNQYISVMLQFGIIGFVIFLNIFYQIYKFEAKDEGLRFLMLAVTLAIGIGLTMTMFNLRVFLQLWILMLAVTMMNPASQTIEGNIPDQRTFLVQTISVGLLIYLIVFIKNVLF